VTDVILSVRALRKQFGTNVAVAGVDLDVGRGERLGIIGPNGSGKTTLIN
jgi:branched-chain amino acid transport system ATP-binding protein